MNKQLFILISCVTLLLFAGSAQAQFGVSVANQRNSCTTQDNGSIDIVIVNAASPTLTNIFGPVNFSNLAGGVGDHTHPLIGLKPSAPGFYVVVVQDASFNTVSTSFQITSVTPGLSFNTPPVVSPNTVCTAAPGPDGSIALDVTGGTGPYSYSWTGPTAVGNVSTATGLAKGTYSVFITDAGSNCTLNGGPFVITDPGPLPFTISSTDLIICDGEDFVLTLDDTDLTIGGSAVSYQVFEAAAPLGAPVAGDGNDVTINLSGLTPGPHTLYVEAQADQCGPVQSTNTLLVNVELPPTVSLGAMPAVCSGITATSITYSVTFGTPNQYSITYDATALGQGFANVVLTALPASPIPIVVPAAGLPGLYNATLRVRDSGTGCFSDMLITVQIHPLPTISAVVDAQACLGAATADLTYGGTTDSPDQYSLVFDGAAQTAGFIDVVNAVLSPPTAIVITIPGTATVGSYNANLTVRNSITGCVSLIEPIQVIINENASLTPGTNPSVCSGATTANLTYAAPTPTADRYSIDFDGTAEGQLFADVGLTVLPASPIVITVPAGALPATYNAVLTVSNSVTGCFTNHPITVTVLANPTISLGADPAVCAGVTVANLTYTATTANEYSLTFDAAAITAGFANVGFTALAGAPSQIGIVVPAAAAPAPYSVTLTIRDTGTGCISSFPVIVTVNENPTITLDFTDPEVCSGGTSVDLTYSATTGTPDQYSIDFDVAAEGQLFADVVNSPLLGSPVSITVPAGAAPGIYNAIFTVRNNTTGCVSMNLPITVEINSTPTISLGAMPEVCAGVTAAGLSYATTTGTPNQYSITYDATALGQGFANVVLTALPASPIPIVVPAAGLPGLYNATLRVRDSGTGCFSDMLITVQIHPLPTISAVVDAQACLGAATADLTYGGTTDSPDQYSLVFDGAAQTAGFIDVVNAVLSPPTAIVITIPGTATVGSYNANLTVRNSITGCVSLIEPIQVIINENASLTPGTNPSVCSGATTANLTYAAPTPTADRYSIDFDGTAEGQLFADVGLTVLPASPIVITVPAGALPATYNAVLTVSNSVTGCFTNHPITVTVLANPTISLGADPAVCAGVTVANLTYTATTANEYSLTFDAAAITAGFANVGFTALAGAPSQIGIVVPAAAAPAPYSVTLTIRDTGTGCISSFPVIVTVNENPTITLDFTDPEVCSGGTSVDLTYSATTGTPDQYSIDFDVAAEGQLFADVVVNGPITGTPISITVPAGAASGIYNAELIVRNTSTSCFSPNMPITVEVKPNPTITLGTNPLVCEGVTTANLPYTATTEVPDQYTIDFDAAAETAGFIDVGLTLLPATPIVVAVPVAGPIGVYNGAVTVRNSTTGCSSVLNSFTVTIGVDVSVGAVADVCVDSDALIPYSSPIGNPNRYSVDFDAAAEASGFVDVVNAALVPSNITVDVPNGIAGVFNGVVSVNNSVTGCASSQKAFSVVVGTTITVGANPAVCVGTTTADVIYTATTGGPDQYSIDFDAAAEAAGFADVTTMAITASPLVIAVPAGALVATYNFEISVTNSLSGCGSIPLAMTVDVESAANAFAGVDQTICAGSNYLLAGSTIGNAASTGQWSITTQPTGGDGSVTPGGFVVDPSTVAFMATVSGDYVLTLTTDDPSGTCLPAQDDVTITVTAIPVVAAGQTKTICGNEEVAYEILLTPVNSPSNTVFNWADPDGAGPATAGTGVPMGATGTIHLNDRLINNGATDIVVTYQVTPSVGSCIGTQVDIAVTVRPSPLLDNQAPKTICSGDNVNYEILLSPTNTPAGTTFSWPDPDGAASGTSQLNIPADPAGTVHITDLLYNGSGSPIDIIYSIIATAPNGCRAIPKDVVITVNSGAIAEAGVAQSICSSGTATLGGASIGGLATAGTWSIFNGPAGGDGVLSVTTPTATPATVTFTANVDGDYTLRLTTDDPAGSCVVVQDDVVVTVRPLSDPACAGGGGGGTGTCATVVIVPTSTPATCSDPDGSIVFSINPFVPVVNTTGVRIDIVGTSAHNSSITSTIFNESTFTGLPYGSYDYTIEYGDPSCIKSGTVTIARAGTVGVPTFSNPIDPVCFGSTGTVTIDVLGETGNPLEWSVDALTWTPFIAGNAVPGIPGGTNTISVRRTSADACASGAVLTLANPTQITTSLTPAPATCANNDGTISVTAVTGGTGPYTFLLNTAALTMPADNIIRGLTAGSYDLLVTDAEGCSRTLTTSITFPGFVAHSAPVITPPDCTGGGGNGIISVQITDTGSYEFGTTTDPVAPPVAFTPTGGNTITVSNLVNGTYAIWIQPVGTGTQCATKVGGLLVSGAYPVSVNATNTDVVCFDDKAIIELSSITGAPAVAYAYELTNTGTNVVSTGAITAGQALTAFTLSDIDPGNYSIRILQDQSTVAAACTAPIGSAPVVLSVDGPTAVLDTLAVVRTISYPDLATGTARVEVSPSGKEPYEARLELTAPQFPGQSFVQDWTTVDVNVQTLKFEHTFQHLYSGEYELRIVDAMGCEKIFSFSVGIDPTLMVPNIFTPNGDGVNEVFFIRNLPDNSSLVITNRWGKEVFQSNAYSNDWDGGEIVDGVYFYHLILPDQAITGWVEIHRGQ